MADRFTLPIQAFRSAAELLAGENVDLYFPDGTAIEDVVAVPVSRTSQTELEGGVLVEVRIRTFDLKASDFGSLEPVRDLEIIWRSGVYRVIQQPGSRVWDWADHQRVLYRVNTVKVPLSEARNTVYANPDGKGYANPDGKGYATP